MRSLIAVNLLLIMILSSFSNITAGTDHEDPEEVETISSIPFTSGPESHDPIFLWGNTNLNNTASAEGWSGNGTDANPYVVENLSIDGQSIYECIFIRDTTLHILIRDCVLFNNSYGIFILDSNNITIKNITIQDCWTGIYVDEGQAILEEGQ
ncbi:MAG: right-handed parallel beta-helix repeat-containing protein [Thermoplasmatota archaeon]